MHWIRFWYLINYSLILFIFCRVDRVGDRQVEEFPKVKVQYSFYLATWSYDTKCESVNCMPITTLRYHTEHYLDNVVLSRHITHEITIAVFLSKLPVVLLKFYWSLRPL